MATLSITVPDAVVPRIRTAMGHTDPITLQRIDATVQEVQDAIKTFIKAQVINYESGVEAATVRNAVSGEVW